MGKREFHIDTPLGMLRVYAKHKDDAPNDDPGMFVEFMGKEEGILLACIEYDSDAKGIYGRLYGDIHSDDPTESIRYEELEEWN